MIALPGEEVTIIGPNEVTYRIRNPGPGRTGDKLANCEPYEKRLLIDIYQHHLVGTAVDVGAHIGNHTLWLAAICGLRVMAFEPHPQSLANMTHNLAINEDLGMNVTVSPMALGNREGRARLTGGYWIEFDPSRSDSGTLVPDAAGDVLVVRFDDWFTVDDLVVVKVDVEGTEADVLAGMAEHLNRCQPIVYAEANDQGNELAVGQILRPLGYTMTRGIHMGSTMQRWEVVP